MSFSTDVRAELARIMPAKTCCRRAELAALLLLNGSIIRAEETILQVELDSAATARKVFLLIKEELGLQPAVSMEQRKRFRKTRVYLVKSVIMPGKENVLSNLQLTGENGVIGRQARWKLLARTCCKRAFLRGAFLSSGSINRPEGEYHLELILPDPGMALELMRIMSKLDLEARQVERKNTQVLYLKESDKIADFLLTIGANIALLDFENVRIIKSMRNSVNRQVNCETANLAKTIDASVRQIELIERIVARRGWEYFPPHLRDLAQLRVEYPDSPLKELGEMLNPPLSKSGAAHRMHRLEELADTLLEEF
ncbi:MAG: DNA-binding protein WhiA [Syntrophomonadaceae bacterium]|nr:DNA-binding protein WhiA [Syntrophomonadaceae bacterium]